MVEDESWATAVDDLSSAVDDSVAPVLLLLDESVAAPDELNNCSIVLEEVDDSTVLEYSFAVDDSSVTAAVDD